LRWAIPVSLVITTVVIASLTVGRDIYYGNREGGLLSFAIISLVGYLFFFLFVPVEPAFIYYLTGNLNVWELNVVAIITTLISLTADYVFGLMLSTRIIDSLIGRKRYEDAQHKIKKYGNMVILVFSFLPLSSPLISLAAGMLKYRKRDTLIYTFIGVVLKYLSLTLLLVWL